MKFLFGTVVVSVASLVLLTFVEGIDVGDSIAQGEAPSGSSTSQLDGPLEIAQDKDDEIRGSLHRPGMLATKFRGEVKTPDESRSAIDARFAITNVEVGALKINAKRNLRTETVVQGAGGKRITAEQKRALTALCKEFERSFGPVGAQLPPEEDLLVRSTCFFAEAPAGAELKTETVPKPSVSQEETAPADEFSTEYVNVAYRHDETDKELLTPTKEECAQAKASGNFTTFVACQRSDNDGIRYLSCSLRTHRLGHDAKAHCWRWNYNGLMDTFSL
jgi:hypothetical protein